MAMRLALINGSMEDWRDDQHEEWRTPATA